MISAPRLWPQAHGCRVQPRSPQMVSLKVPTRRGAGAWPWVLLAWPHLPALLLQPVLVPWTLWLLRRGCASCWWRRQVACLHLQRRERIRGITAIRWEVAAGFSGSLLRAVTGLCMDVPTRRGGSRSARQLVAETPGGGRAGSARWAAGSRRHEDRLGILLPCTACRGFSGPFSGKKILGHLGHCSGIWRII